LYATVSTCEVLREFDSTFLQKRPFNIGGFKVIANEEYLISVKRFYGRIGESSP
jgi:hypothetical protein